MTTPQSNVSSEFNSIMEYLTDNKQWFESYLGGEETHLWFVPEWADKDSALRLEVLVFEIMLEYVQKQINAGQSIEEIRLSGANFAQQKHDEALADITLGRYNEVLANAFQRMSLAFDIIA